MQFKPVPEPPSDLEAIGPILEAVPSTAGAVDDCCRHLLEETRLDARSEAETWLVFLRALELVTEEPAGYRRSSRAETPDSDGPLELEALRRTFRERVYAADTVLEILARSDEPLSVTDVYDELHEAIPRYERERGSDRVEDARTERVRRLLEWAVVLESAERGTPDDRYRCATASE